jgi:hypothetical protein
MSDRDGINDLRGWWGDVIVLSVTRSSKQRARNSTLECPMISPVDEPESNMNAWPNLFYSTQKEDGVSAKPLRSRRLTDERIRRLRTFLSHRRRR